MTLEFDPWLDQTGTEDGVQMYLCPVFLSPSPLFGAALLGGQWRAGGFRIIGRMHGNARSFDQTISADQLTAVIANAPAGIAHQLQSQLDTMMAVRPPLPLSGYRIGFDKPQVMGIVNVTPDSFSDGGQFDQTDAAIAHGLALIEAGADILDIGGESTRPGADPVWEGEEMDRVLPVIAGLQDAGVPISIDTRKASVMEAAVAAGASIINDVSALTYDKASLEIAAAAGQPTILMHSKGLPKTMQDAPDYVDVTLDVYDWLQDRIEACEAAGLARSHLILDPGIGFGKRVLADNLALMRMLGLYHGLGCPLLIGASRKRFIGALTTVEDAGKRQVGSVAAALDAVSQGAQIVRVHDVRETREALDYWQGMTDSSMMDLGPVLV